MNQTSALSPELSYQGAGIARTSHAKKSVCTHLAISSFQSGIPEIFDTPDTPTQY
jgi:hypothetical protein